MIGSPLAAPRVHFPGLLRASLAWLAMLAAAGGVSSIAGALPVTYVQPAPDQAGLLTQVSRSVVTVAAVAVDGSTTLGSGFFVSADGRLLTSAHVVERAAALTVTGPDGARHEASRVAVDAAVDVAELAIDGRSVPLPLAAAAPGAGAEVYVLGNPGGESPSSAAAGRVTALHARARTEAGRIYPDLVATDASSTPGTSGGAVVDVLGRVVGLVALGDPRSLDTLAIPVERFRPTLATWAALSPAAFVKARPVGAVGRWGGSCDVAHCSASADVTNQGASGSLTARFEFWVGSQRVAGCIAERALVGGETATLSCSVPIDLRSAAGQTYTVTAPTVAPA